MKKILNFIDFLFTPILGIFLNMLSWALEPIVEVLNFFTVMVLYSKEKGFWTNFGDYNKSQARDRDRFAGRNYRTFFNFAFLKKDSLLKFGDVDLYISSILGYGRINSSLTWVGLGIYYILYFIDFPYWFKGGHCIVSFNHEIEDGKLNDKYLI